MAKLIPSVISENVKSSAEFRLFKTFKELKKCDDWVIFHSMGLADHVSKIHSEVDFIVVAPNYGVFILEVKGGAIRKQDGVWVYTNKYGEENIKRESPFDQAKSALHSILDKLRELKGKNYNKNYIWGYGVMFPDVNYNIDSIEYNPNQVFDARDKGDIVSYIKRLSNYYREKEQFEAKCPLTNYDAEEITKVLKADFELEVPLKKAIDYSEDILIELTEEQYTFVQGLTYNDRCLIHGGAGTGKTVLSTKVTQDLIKNGKKVALFCYNLLLSEKLKKDLGQLPPGCYVGSFTKFLEELVVKHNLVNLDEVEDKTQFYTEELPCLALEALEKENIIFDTIIIDEAQDLVNDLYIEIMDLILKGGLNNGRWCMFGDFDIQTIYNKDVTLDNVINMLKNRNSQFITYELKLNCRNTLNIQKEMKKVIPNYNTGSRNKDGNSPKVKNFKYNNTNELIDYVNDETRKLLDKGLEKKDIIILSPYILNETLMNGINGITKYRETDKGIRYATIPSFKGLESKVIFLINIYNRTSKEIIFTGCSRAKTLLYIFEKK